jgi:hypothetical protein
MENVKFKYLYRDGSNFKRWSDIIFSNPNDLPLEGVAKALGDAFTKDGLFIAHQVRVPEVFIYDEGNANADDHCYHELHEVTESSEIPNDRHGRSIDRFIAEVQRAAIRGWFVFDPFDRWLGRSSPL